MDESRERRACPNCNHVHNTKKGNTGRRGSCSITVANQCRMRGHDGLAFGFKPPVAGAAVSHALAELGEAASLDALVRAALKQATR